MPFIFSGALKSFEIISAPISESGSITRFIGRLDRLSSPIKTDEKSLLAKIPDINLIVVPEFPQSRFEVGADNLLSDVMVKFPLNSALIPKAWQTLREDNGSCPFEKFLIIDFPFASDENITALWEIDLSAGIVIVPLRLEEILFTIFCIG